MDNSKKLKRIVLALFIIVSVLLLWFVVDLVKALFFNEVSSEFSIVIEWDILGVASNIVVVLIVFSTLLLTLVLLHSTRTAETPFLMKNVKLLRAIAALLVFFEPFMYFTQWLYDRSQSMIIDEGNGMLTSVFYETHISYGGFILTAGLVVYCVSVVFEYGISLQKQADETL